MIEYSSTLFCSLEVNVTGIKFYEGLVHLQSLCRVEFERDYSCLQDKNAIFVIRVLPEKRVVLGHVEKRVGAATISLPPLKRL